MAFQFCCPQGHVLQGELSQVGQLFQCPMCGSNFLIPPPTMDPATTGGQSAGGSFFQGAATWPGGNAPGPSFPAQGPMPGMVPSPGMPPQSMPMMPGGPYPMSAPQPFAFGPAAVNPPSPAAPPAETPQQPPPTAQSETGRPGFDLGFDPGAKASLPFEIPGQSDPEAMQAAAAPFSAAPLPAPSFPAPSFPGGTVAASTFPAPSMPAPTFAPSGGGQDFLQSAPAGVPEAAAEAAPETAAPQDPPKVLHIRCPSGHLVKAKSDLLGKNGRCPACKITFELRYEDSIEFQRRTQKILHREEIKTGRAWMAWAFLASFVVLVGLVVLMLALSR